MLTHHARLSEAAADVSGWAAASSDGGWPCPASASPSSTGADMASCCERANEPTRSGGASQVGPSAPGSLGRVGKAGTNNAASLGHPWTGGSPAASWSQSIGKDSRGTGASTAVSWQVPAAEAGRPQWWAMWCVAVVRPAAQAGGWPVRARPRTKLATVQGGVSGTVTGR